MGDTNSNDTCQNHERFRIIRNVRIDIHQRLKIKQAASIWTITTRTFPQQNHFRNKNIFTARPFSQQSTRPLSQQDYYHSKTIFKTRPYSQQENMKTRNTHRCRRIARGCQCRRYSGHIRQRTKRHRVTHRAPSSGVVRPYRVPGKLTQPKKQCWY